MSAQADVEVLRVLLDDQKLEDLNGHVSSLALIRVLGVARDEVVHSRLLAALLDPRRNRSATIMLRALLRGIVSYPRLERGVAERLRVISEAPWERVAVRRELFFIDVVVEITSAEGSAVIGIENKIDAGEQPQQISRYQKDLRRAYPDRTAVMIFLTPTGREPTTHHLDSEVPVVAVSYALILAVVKKALQRAPIGSRDEHALAEVAAHLEEDILGNPEVRKLVRELWRTHGRALQLALEHRPRLNDIRETYIHLMEKRYGEDAYFYYYPEKRGDLREIKMGLSSFDDNGLPFTFMLRVDDEGRPNVRVLIWRDSYRSHARSLAAWAQRVNISAGTMIDEGFTPLAGWREWHRVFLEEDYPTGDMIDEQAFDEDTAEAAADAVSALVEQLRPYIEFA